MFKLKDPDSPIIREDTNCLGDTIRFFSRKGQVEYPRYSGILYIEYDDVVEPCCRGFDILAIKGLARVVWGKVYIEGSAIVKCPYCGAKPIKVQYDYDPVDDDTENIIKRGHRY